MQESQRPSYMDNDQAIARKGWDDANHNLYGIIFFTTSGPAFSAVRRFEGNTREDGVGHGQDASAAQRETFDGCSREALRVAHREMEPVQMRSDENRGNFFTRRTGSATASFPSPPRRTPWTASTRISSCSAFHQSTTKSARSTLRGRTATLQTFGE